MQLEMPLERLKKPTKGGWHHDLANWKSKKCTVCSTLFKPKSGVHKFCSEECKGKHKYIIGKVTTESQYKNISGNWNRYLSRLLYVNGKKRSSLTRETLLVLLEKQNYKCALSGEDLTCILDKSKVYYTNASVDQIVPNAGYTEDNIRLVQRKYNVMKWVQSDEELIESCKRIIEHNDRKKKT